MLDVLKNMARVGYSLDLVRLRPRLIGRACVVTSHNAAMAFSQGRWSAKNCQMLSLVNSVNNLISSRSLSFLIGPHFIGSFAPYWEKP
jgi:hypothetical protein